MMILINNTPGKNTCISHSLRIVAKRLSMCCITQYNSHLLNFQKVQHCGRAMAQLSGLDRQSRMRQPS